MEWRTGGWVEKWNGERANADAETPEFAEGSSARVPRRLTC